MKEACPLKNSSATACLLVPVSMRNKALSLIGQRKRSEKKLLPPVLTTPAFRIVLKNVNIV
ncbi:hypothetical protein T10_7675 [Trichinella papuae]|uniref:Uncharacterized protein n=1 Tax=Trichinella papuae TaxID=268474 RepID=A0A0V1MDU6_9BILA|nr:hypothetical protein T10_7675 [Trichinella papuae]